jgi:group I intron endonuclease
MNTGIYCIEHKDSGKKYIGSAVRITRRFNDHKRELRYGVHGSLYLQNAWNKYGGAAFEFRKLLVCSKENLIMYEQICMNHYQVCDRERGFNISPTAGSSLGVYPSVETRAKQSAAKKGRALTQEHRANISVSLMGHAVSEETRAKFSKANKGKVLSLEHRAKCSASHLAYWARRRSDAVSITTQEK